MKALEAGTTFAAVFSAASIILFFAIAVAVGIVANVSGFSCW